MAATNRRKSEHSCTAANKASILGAVLDLAVEAGYEGTTMADVARVSGLPIGSVYWHFTSKEHLFVTLLDHCFEAWKRLHADNRSIGDLLRSGIVGSAARSNDVDRAADAFWSIALVFALEKRLSENRARRRYLEIRQEMYAVVRDQLRRNMPQSAGGVDDALLDDLLILSRAVIDGFFVAAAAGDQVDFEHHAELAATALDALAREIVARRASVTP